MALAGKKATGRRVTQAMVSNTEGRIAKELKKMKATQQALDSKKKLEEIIEYLEQKPELVPQAHAHIVGGILEKCERPGDDSDEDAEEFQVQYKTLQKSPKTWLQTFLAELEPRMNANVMRDLRKKDSNIAHRLMYLATACEPSTPFGPMSKAIWKNVFKERYVLCGRPLAKLGWTRDWSIKWGTCGVYKLLPELADADPKQHRFTNITLGGTSYTFEEHQVVDGTWSIMNNWSVKTAFMSSGGKNPTTRLCSGHFGGKEELSQIIAPMKFPEDAAGDDGEDPDSEESDEAGGEVGEQTPTGPTPRKKRRVSPTTTPGEKKTPPARTPRAPASDVPTSDGSASQPKRQGVPGVSSAGPTLPPAASWVQGALAA